MSEYTPAKITYLIRIAAPVRAVLIGLLFLCLTDLGWSAPPRSARESISNFVESMARHTYNLAWPTATYRSYSIVDVRDVEGGYDVAVKFSGLSAFDNSDLWFILAFRLGSDGLSNPRVLKHNAIIMPPFGTVKVTAAVAADLASEYAKSQRAAVPVASRAGAVCLINDTGVELKYKYHWGDSPWQSYTVEPNRAALLWWPYETSATATPEFLIEYDDSFADGYTPQRYVLEPQSTALPVTCEASRQYRFSTEGSLIRLQRVR